MERQHAIILFAALTICIAGCAVPGSRYTPWEKSATRPQGVRPSPAAVESGITAYRAGNLTTAEDQFEKTLSLQPDNAEAYYYLAEIRHKQKDYASSSAFLDKAEIYFGPDDRWLGRVYTLMGKNDEARGRARAAAARYRQALERDSTNREALIRLKGLPPP